MKDRRAVRTALLRSVAIEIVVEDGFDRSVGPGADIERPRRGGLGAPLPPNTVAELQRDMTRLSFITDQVKEIEAARLEHLERAPKDSSHAMVRLLARVIGVGIETADMLVH